MSLTLLFELVDAPVGVVGSTQFVKVGNFTNYSAGIFTSFVSNGSLSGSIANFTDRVKSDQKSRIFSQWSTLQSTNFTQPGRIVQAFSAAPIVGNNPADISNTTPEFNVLAASSDPAGKIRAYIWGVILDDKFP